MWPALFRETYAWELRPESADAIRSLYWAERERYDAVATQALHHLAKCGHFTEASAHARSFAIEIPPGMRLWGNPLRLTSIERR